MLLVTLKFAAIAREQKGGPPCRPPRPPPMIRVVMDSRTKMKGQIFTQIFYNIYKHLQCTGWLNVTYCLFFHSTALFLFREPFNLICLSMQV